MKKSILFILCALIYVTQIYAQRQVTTFLGIPVDGTRTEMMAKLKAKGFKQIDPELLTGTFNGEDVILLIITNRDKVCRICVIPQKPRDKNQIKIRYNELVRQFIKSNKYASHYTIEMAGSEEEILIGDDEDISYQMTTNNKSYSLSFFQSLQITGKIYSLKDILHMHVWIRIAKDGPDYRVEIFYDNKLNEAQDKDL